MAKSQYTAFPTFGGPKEGGGIMDVKLSPSQIRFPTARRQPNRETIEPDLTEKLAPLLPFLFEGIGGMFKGNEEAPLNRDDYLTSIGADLKDPSKLESAQADAYSLFGAPEEKDGFGFDDIFDIVAASQLGKGATSFAKGTVAKNRAKEQDRITKEGRRASFIQKQVSPDAFQFLNLQDTIKARTGVVDIRPGYFDKETGQTFIKDPKNKDANKLGFVVAGENWIDPAKLASGSGNNAVDMLKNPFLKELMKKDVELSAREQAVGSFLNIANPTITELIEASKDPSKASTTFVASLATIGNSAITNFEQIASLDGTRPVTDYFNENNGNVAKQLYLEIKEGDENAINQATNALEESTGLNLRSLMGPLSYDNVTIRANFLQMAYMAAAANGQTGRTLSDKDLAYHLQIIGFGSTQDPEILWNNVLRFGDRLVSGLDTETQLAIPKNGFQRYAMNDGTFQSVITRLYTPSMTKDVDGKDTPNWLDYDSYVYKPFLERATGIGNIDQWVTHEGTFYDRKTQGTTKLRKEIDPTEELNKKLNEVKNIEAKY